MSDKHRGKRGGKRGNTFARSVKAEVASGKIDNGAACGVVTIVPKIAHDQVKVGEAIYFDNTDTAESTDDKLIPYETMKKLVRRSLTDQQGLKLFPSKIETEAVTTRQQNRKGKTVEIEVSVPVGKDAFGNTVFERKTLKTKELTEVTNNRVVWRSTRNLLRRAVPDQLENIRFTRLNSKGRRDLNNNEIERPAVVEVPVNTETEVEEFTFSE